MSPSGGAWRIRGLSTTVAGGLDQFLRGLGGAIGSGESQSGGTVEQYKQPHLMPDLGLIDTFASGETEAATTPEPAR